MITYKEIIDRLTSLERALETTDKFGGAVIVTSCGIFSFGQKEMRDAVRQWIEALYKSALTTPQPALADVTVKHSVHEKNFNGRTEYTGEFMSTANQMYKWVNSPETPI